MRGILAEQRYPHYQLVCPWWDAPSFLGFKEILVRGIRRLVVQKLGRRILACAGYWAGILKLKTQCTHWSLELANRPVRSARDCSQASKELMLITTELAFTNMHSFFQVEGGRKVFTKVFTNSAVVNEIEHAVKVSVQRL